MPIASEAEKDAGRAGGEFGQMVFSLVVCNEDPRYLAMALDTAPVYVSENGGKSWELRRSGIHSNGAQSVAFDPASRQVLWAAGLKSRYAPTRKEAIDAGAVNFGSADGLYRSTDLGRSWSFVHKAGYYRGQAQNEYFAFDSRTSTSGGSQTIYAITHDQGLLKSTDFGASWSGNVLPVQAIGNAVVWREPGWLWFAADEGLWVSTNAGATWTPRRVVGGNEPVAPVKGLVIHPQDPRIAYVALEYASDLSRGVWRTTNGGGTWDEVNGAPDGGALLPRGSGAVSWSWGKLAMSPTNPDVLYVAASGSWLASPYVTLDQGRHWFPWVKRESGILSGTSVWNAEGLAVHPDEPMTAFHVYPFRRTTDGGKTWHIYGDGVSGTRREWRTSIAFSPQDPAKRMFFHYDSGAKLTTNHGGTWARAAPPQLSDAGCCGGTQTQPGGVFDPAPGKRRVISAAGNWVTQRLVVSDNDGLPETDGGTSWRLLERPANGGLYLGDFRFFAWHPQAQTVVYVGSTTGALRSSDRGATWSELNRPIRAMFQSNGDILYSVVYAGGRSIVERSTDRGATWIPFGGPLGIHIRDLDVDPIDPDRVYAAASDAVRGVVYVSSPADGGIAWVTKGADAGLSPDFFGLPAFKHVAVDPRRPNVIYAGQGTNPNGAGGGIFRSTDRGETWSNINRNLGLDLSVWSITVDPFDSSVWLGTDYGNVRGAAER